MGKLEELQKRVADWFNTCEDMQTITKLSELNNLATEAAQESQARVDELVAENKELLKDYKELVVHTSFKDQHNKPTDNIGGVVSFEEALAQFQKGEK